MELLDRDPRAWKRQVDEYSAAKNDINHYIEHWIAEYWDSAQQRGRLLDANDTFLKAHSGPDTILTTLMRQTERGWVATFPGSDRSVMTRRRHPR